MGCDIHAHSEVKINGVWHHLSGELPFERNYDLFTRMAGVRRYSDEIESISEPRGLPEDLSFLTRFIYDEYGVEGHSHSWLSAAEVSDLGEWMEEQRKKYNTTEYWYPEKVIGYIFGNGWDQFTKYRDDLPEGVEDARLVFWFDN